MAGLKDIDTRLSDISTFDEVSKENSPMVTRQSELSNFRFDYSKVGRTSTSNGTFKTNQGDNTGRDTSLGERTDSAFQGETGTTLPPEVKGRVQATQAVKDVGVEKTALFVAKQFGLHLLNAQEDTRVYDPTALAQNLVVPTDNFIDGNLFGEHEEEKINKQVNQSLTYLKASPNIVGLNQSTGTDNKTIKVSYNMRNNKDSDDMINNTLIGIEDTLPEDFIKFRIKDVNTGRIIQFPAYLDDITDNSSAEYTPTRYIGRADQTYVYSGYTRSISFGFKVVALSEKDLPVMWNKIDYLKQLTLPLYDKGLLGEEDTEPRPKAPFVELTIGDLYVGQPGYFSSINLTIPQSSNWETKEGHQLTHICNVSVDFTYIGKKLPKLNPAAQTEKDMENESRQFDMKVPESFALKAKSE
jgi:hypothetical protein